MTNVTMKQDGNILHIEVDLAKEFGRSKTGKTIIVASTNGNVSAPGNADVKVGLNVYRK